MRAAFHIDANRLEVRDVPAPEPGAGEALVAVRACSWCGSDKHDMETPPRRERIPGHEFAGVIAAAPPESGFREGDEVAVDPMIVCGRCAACLSGNDHLCDKVKVYGCRGDQPDGAMAELVRVKLPTLVRMPPGLDFKQAALGDPLGVALHTANLAGELGGRTVAIFGAGSIGLMLAQVVALRRAARVLLVDVDAAHLAVGRQLGRFETIDASDAEHAQAVLREARPDVVVELAGGETPTLDWAIACCRRGGSVLLVGQRPRGARIHYPTVMFAELRLQGVFGKTSRDFREAINLLAQGRINVAPIITDRFSLEQAQASFERCLAPGALKVIVSPGGN